MAVSMVTSSASTGTTSTVSGARASASAPKSASAIAVQVSALAKLFAAQPINRTLDETLLSTKLTSTAFPFITLPARGTVVQAYADGGTRVDSGDDSTLATYTLDAEDVKQPITLTLTPTSIGSLLPTTAADYLSQLKSAKSISEFDKAVRTAASAGITVSFGLEIGDKTIAQTDYKNIYAPLTYTAPLQNAQTIALTPAATAQQDYLDGSRKAPFNLVIDKDFLSLTSGEISKLNDLVDKGMINSIQLTGSNSTVVRVTDAQLQKFAKLIGKLKDTTKFAMVYEKMSVDQLLAMPTELMGKLEKPLTITDTATALTNPDAWNKLSYLTNAKMLNTVQLDTVNDTNDLDLTYSQLKAGANILTRIAGTFGINVNDVTAANANTVSATANVKRVNLRDSIDNLLFLGSNIQKIADANRMGSIATTSDSLSITNSVAFFKSHLGVIGALAKAGKLDNLILTDLSAGSLTLTSQQVAQNADALKKLQTGAVIKIQNSGPVSAADAVAINDLLNNASQIQLANPLTIVDTAANLLTSENQTAINALYSNVPSLVSKITVQGDVSVLQAQGDPSTQPDPTAGLKDFLGFPAVMDAFRIKDTSENIAQLSSDNALYSRITLIRATSPIAVSDVAGFLAKGNLLAKLDSGFDVADTIQSLLPSGAVPADLKTLALKGKLRTVSASVPVQNFNQIDTVKQAFRLANLGAYLSGFSVTGSYSDLVTGAGGSMTVPLASKLRALADSGKLKDISLSGPTTVVGGAFLFNSLKGRNLSTYLSPLAISDTVAGFGWVLNGAGTNNVAPRLFPNLAGVVGLQQNGKLASLTVDSLLTSNDAVTLDLKQQLIDRKLI